MREEKGLCLQPPYSLTMISASVLPAEPTQADLAHQQFTTEEKEWCCQCHLYFYCGEPGYVISACPIQMPKSLQAWRGELAWALGEENFPVP